MHANIACLSDFPLMHCDICLETVLVYLLRESDVWSEVCWRTVANKP